MHGNKSLYSLIKEEEGLFIFQNDENTLSLSSEWLEGQIYALPNAVENKDTVNFGTMGGGISEVFRVDSAKMQPVGQRFRIILEK